MAITYDDYLTHDDNLGHYGVKGMGWGGHDPDGCESREDYLTIYGVKGMKWPKLKDRCHYTKDEHLSAQAKGVVA